MEKWEHFSKTATHDKDTIYILDSSIFQAQIFVFLWNNAPYERIERFVNKLCDIVKSLNPSLIYLYRENTETTIDYLEKVRGAQNLENIWKRDKVRPYYQDKPEGAEGFKHFLRDYAKSAGLLYDSIDCNKISIEITKADWHCYENEMLSFIEIENIVSPQFIPPNGMYINEELKYTINVDGFKMIARMEMKKKLLRKVQANFILNVCQ